MASLPSNQAEVQKRITDLEARLKTRGLRPEPDVPDLGSAPSPVATQTVRALRCAGAAESLVFPAASMQVPPFSVGKIAGALQRGPSCCSCGISALCRGGCGGGGGADARPGSSSKTSAGETRLV